MVFGTTRMCDLIKIHPNVKLGNDVVLGNFVIIGESPREPVAVTSKTVIGNNAVIRSHTVIYSGNNIGDNFQTGHGVLLREENEIGDNVSIGSHSVIEHHVKIGNGVRVHSQVFVPEYSTLEDGCWIGPNVVLTNARYPASKDAKKTLKGPLIKQGAKIGANVTILPGVIVGRNAIVGAGAVVVQDIPDGKVVVGNPAKVINDVAGLDAYSNSNRQIN